MDPIGPEMVRRATVAALLALVPKAAAQADLESLASELLDPQRRGQARAALQALGPEAVPWTPKR